MRNWLVFSTVFVLGATYALSLRSEKPDQHVAKPVSLVQPEEEPLDVRLSRAHVKLAKLGVERAIEANRQTPNLYSSEFIELLQLHVEIDEAELEQDLKQEEGDPREIWIRNAEASLKIANLNLKAAKSLFEKSPSINSKYDLEMAKVNLEIAEFELEQTKQVNINSTKAAFKNLQRQINQLQHQVLQLRMKH
jgi:hypothetical protein